MNKENCALKLVDEIILYYDARSKKHQKSFNLFQHAVCSRRLNTLHHITVRLETAHRLASYGLAWLKLWLPSPTSPHRAAQEDLVKLSATT